MKWLSNISISLAAICGVGVCGLGTAHSQNAASIDVRIVATFIDSVPASAAVKVAFERGYFKDAGLNLTFASAIGGGDTLRPVTTGDADIAIGSPAASTLAVLKNPGIKIMAIWVPYNALDWIGLKPLDKLDGARVGGAVGGSTVNLLLSGLEEQLHVKFVIEKAGTGSQADNWDAVRAGHLQASWSMEPFTTLKRQTEGAVVVIDASKSIPAFPLDFVVVDSKFAAAHAQAMKGFFHAVERIFNEFYDPTKQAALAKDLASVMVFPEPVIHQYLTSYGNERLSKAYTLKMNADVFKNVSHLLQEAKMISAPVEWPKYVDQSYLPEGDRLAELP